MTQKGVGRTTEAVLDRVKGRRMGINYVQVHKYPHLTFHCSCMSCTVHSLCLCTKYLEMQNFAGCTT